jgi:hypothetical protein
MFCFPFSTQFVEPDRKPGTLEAGMDVCEDAFVSIKIAKHKNHIPVAVMFSKIHTFSSMELNFPGPVREWGAGREEKAIVHNRIKVFLSGCR